MLNSKLICSNGPCEILKYDKPMSVRDDVSFAERQIFINNVPSKSRLKNFRRLKMMYEGSKNRIMYVNGQKESLYQIK